MKLAVKSLFNVYGNLTTDLLRELITAYMNTENVLMLFEFVGAAARQ